MSTYDILHRIQQTPNLSQTQKGVLIALATFADMEGRCHPSMGKLATYVSVTDRAVRLAIRDLEERGLVVSSRRDNLTTKYQIQWSKLPERNDRNVDPPGTKIRPERASTRNQDPEGAEPASGGGRIDVPEGAEGRSAEVTIQVTNPKQPLEATILVPPVPVSTPPPAAQEPPCPPTPSHVSAKEATNTPPALFNLGSVDTAESQRNGKKPASKVQKTAKDEDVERVWNHFRQWHPLTKQAVPKGDGEQIAICLKEWTTEEIMAVFTWAHTSTHKDAVWLREHDRDCVKTLTVQADFSRRLELAMREQGTKGPAPAPAQPAPQEDPAAIWDSVIKRRSTGIRIMPDDIPARVQGAIRAAGGWNQIGLLNDYTEKQAKTAFIAAYRNPPPNGHQRTA